MLFYSRVFIACLIIIPIAFSLPVKAGGSIVLGAREQFPPQLSRGMRVYFQDKFDTWGKVLESFMITRVATEDLKIAKIEVCKAYKVLSSLKTGSYSSQGQQNVTGGMNQLRGLFVDCKNIEY